MTTSSTQCRLFSRQAEHPATIEIGREPWIGMGVHRAGRARGIEPEAHVVARRRRSDVLPRGLIEQIFEAGVAMTVGAPL